MLQSQYWWIIPILATFSCTIGQSVKKLSENEMQSVLNDYNSKAIELCHQVQLASWDVATDVGNTTKEAAKVR